MTSNKNLSVYLTVAAVGLSLVGYAVYKVIKNRKIDSLTVIKVDTKLIDHVTDTKLLENLFTLAGQAFDNIMKEGKANEQVAMTLYSLFKQNKDGDADEFEKNKQNTKPERYAVWLQQAGKSVEQCYKEYIILVAQIDKQYNETVNGVITGVIQEININRQDANPFAKEVPQPVKPDDTEYIEGLEGEDKRIFEVYNDLLES